MRVVRFKYLSKKEPGLSSFLNNNDVLLLTIHGYSVAISYSFESINYSI